MPPGQGVYQQNCQACHGANREGAESGAALVQLTADPVNNIVAGAPRFDGDAIRAVIATGKGRMPAFPHLSAAEVDNIVSFLTTPAGGRGRRRRVRRPRRRARRIGRAARAHRRFRIGVGAAGRAAAGAGAARRAYPAGTPDYTRYTINEYNTVGNRIKPPFTAIVKYDLNQPAIKWRIPYGDDPALAARGITGTGVPGDQNSIIVTESGLVFGAGRDNLIRAWDSDTGKQLWSSRFGGNFTGSPAMYEMGGRQYLLVPAASTAGGPGVGSGPPTGPIGLGRLRSARTPLIGRARRGEGSRSPTCRPASLTWIEIPVTAVM